MSMIFIFFLSPCFHFLPLPNLNCNSLSQSDISDMCFLLYCQDRNIVDPKEQIFRTSRNTFPIENPFCPALLYFKAVKAYCLLISVQLEIQWHIGSQFQSCNQIEMITKNVFFGFPFPCGKMNDLYVQAHL